MLKKFEHYGSSRTYFPACQTSPTGGHNNRMSEIGILPPRAGNRREPGPDPVPTKRRSTKPVTPNPVEKGTLPQRRGHCGSHKPKEKLRKDLFNLALQEGLLEFLDKEPTETPEPTSRPAPPKQPDRIIWCETTDGELVAKNSDGSICEPEEKAPASTSELERVMTERKIAALLGDTQLVLNLKSLVEAALKNQKLRDQLLSPSGSRQSTTKNAEKGARNSKQAKVPAAPTSAKSRSTNSTRSLINGKIKTNMNRGQISQSGRPAKVKKKGTVH
jgi:hypothetical protein